MDLEIAGRTGRTVDELLATITQSERTRWYAKLELEAEAQQKLISGS